MSWHSPGPVENSEMLVRLVFHPVHLHKKKNEIKPNFFSHVHEQGCSIQRAGKLKSDEAHNLVQKFLRVAGDRSWIGTLNGSCVEVRNITTEFQANRACAVYDTAEAGNQSHAELCQTEYVLDEADQNHLRYELMKAFGGGTIIPPSRLLDGSVWSSLSAEQKDRPRRGLPT